MGTIFFRERECMNENKNFFRKRKQELRKVAVAALMIRYASLVAKSDENRQQLLVDMIQVSHAVLPYF
jgi:hypothetical protein